MLAALGRFSVRHRWLVVVTWAVVLAGALAGGHQYGGSFTNDLTLSNTDSQAAYDTLRERFPDMSGDGMQVVIHSDGGVTSPEVQRAVDGALRLANRQAGSLIAGFTVQPGRQARQKLIDPGKFQHLLQTVGNTGGVMGAAQVARHHDQLAVARSVFVGCKLHA